MTSWRAALRVPAFLLLAGCAARTAPKPAPPLAPALPRAPAGPEALPQLGFSIQAGAFANADNAALLVQILAENGLEAFHFAGDDGLSRVRFGSFSTRELAVERAEALKRGRVIEGFLIVPPQSRPSGRFATGLRGRVVDSAMAFLGTPYRWGGPSAETGFDCSGLTMTAYRLNGLALPRAAAEQYATGAHASREGLQEADLVFFATGKDRRPSHVGLYVGQGRFIHAPGAGKVVRIDDLSQSYYERRFLGGRSYLQ
jgi:hypothetical protein